jgi:hypothetical protein
LTGIEKVKSHIDEYTSSDAIIKDKNVIELDIKLEKLTDDEAAEVKKYVNEVYNKLKDAGL